MPAVRKAKAIATALFNDRLGKVQVESEGMTEIDAEEQSGSFSNFLNERLQKNLGIKFELMGGIVRKPLGWGKFVSIRLVFLDEI